MVRGSLVASLCSLERVVRHRATTHTPPCHPTTRKSSEQPAEEVAAKEVKPARLLRVEELLQAHGENHAQDKRADGSARRNQREGDQVAARWREVKHKRADWACEEKQNR